MSEVTHILERIEQGDSNAAGQLLPLVYQELRNLAAAKMAQEAPDQTLQATALVHEAWLRLTQGQQEFHGRQHFFAAAAEAMRRILIDNARRKRAVRHGGAQRRVDLDKLEIAVPGEEDELLAVNEALDRLASIDPQKAEVVKLKYFVGLTSQQIAAVFEISEPTVKRHLAYARAWLYREINQNS